MGKVLRAICLIEVVTAFVAGMAIIPSISDPSSSRFDQKLQKAEQQLMEFVKEENDGKALNKFQSSPPVFLLVDASNVRGVTGCDWSHVELHQRLQIFSDHYNIDGTVIIWDHGNIPTAIPISSNTLVVFSGLVKRADDIIVRNAGFLQEFKMKCVVITNDRGLIGRLRKSTVFLSSTNDNPVSDNRTSPSLLTLDSTRTIGLLHHRCPSPGPFNEVEDAASKTLQECDESIRAFCKKLGQPRRRRGATWERAVLSEALRRSLICNETAQIELEDFLLPYWRYLRDELGYEVPDIELGMLSSKDDVSFLGPSRMDKKQKRLLARFRAFHSENTG